MKNIKRVFPFIATVTAVAILFSGCRKINDATTLGDGLIPPVDNITTFETFLPVESDNLLYNDTNKVYYADLHALDISVVTLILVPPKGSLISISVIPIT